MKRKSCWSSALFRPLMNRVKKLKIARTEHSAFRYFACHHVNFSNLKFDDKMNLQTVMTVHVGWPARPAEHRAGLDFFGSFCIKAKRTETYSIHICSFFCLCKRKNQRKAHRQRYTAVAGRLDLASVLLLTELNNSYHRHRR